MNTAQVIYTALNEGFKLVPVCDNWYMVWEKYGKKYGSYIPNVPDYQYDAANEIRPYLADLINVIS